MWKYLNPWNWIKGALKAEAKSLIREYGENLRIKVIEAVKSQKTEDDINAFFKKEEDDIIARVDAI